MRWYGFKKKCRRVLGVVSESLGTYRAVLRVSLRFQGGECHTSHKADMRRKKKKKRLLGKIYGECCHNNNKKLAFTFFRQSSPLSRDVFLNICVAGTVVADNALSCCWRACCAAKNRENGATNQPSLSEKCLKLSVSLLSYFL